MQTNVTGDLAARIAEESSTLPREQQSSVLDFVLFLKNRQTEEAGDEQWERIIDDPRPRPKLDAYLESIKNEPDEPMDFGKL